MVAVSCRAVRHSSKQSGLARIKMHGGRFTKSEVLMSLEDYEQKLNAAGWHLERLPDGTLGQIHLPCGIVHWISGEYQGVKRSGWLRSCVGVVMLHGGSDKDDCTVDEFVKRLVMPVVVEVATEKAGGKQRSLF